MWAGVLSTRKPWQLPRYSVTAQPGHELWLFNGRGDWLLPTGYSRKNDSFYDLSRSYEAQDLAYPGLFNLTRRIAVPQSDSAFQHLQLCYISRQEIIQPPHPCI
jgi:hypothetical protein